MHWGENRLPESVDITMKGRVTKAVAQMLKAEVVMYQNDESRYAEVLSGYALYYIFSVV